MGQLSQMYGMPKVESSPTSPLRQPLHPGLVDPAFCYLPSPHGSSLSLSVEVCLGPLAALPPFISFHPRIPWLHRVSLSLSSLYTFLSLLPFIIYFSHSLSPYLPSSFHIPSSLSFPRLKR